MTSDDAIRLAQSLPARVASCTIKEGSISLRFWPVLDLGNTGTPADLKTFNTAQANASDADLALAGHEIMPDPEPDIEPVV